MKATAYIWYSRTAVWIRAGQIDAAGGNINQIAQRFLEETDIQKQAKGHSFLVLVGDVIREYVIYDDPRVGPAVEAGQ